MLLLLDCELQLASKAVAAHVALNHPLPRTHPAGPGPLQLVAPRVRNPHSRQGSPAPGGRRRGSWRWWGAVAELRWQVDYIHTYQFTLMI